MEKVKWLCLLTYYALFTEQSTDFLVGLFVCLSLAGIYEIFCKETFGVKAKNLDFGLQPYKIPDTKTVCKNSGTPCGCWVFTTILRACFPSFRCATWCPLQAPAVPSFHVLKIRCISISSWRNCETSWKAGRPAVRWWRRSTPSICSLLKVNSTVPSNCCM